MNPYTDIGITPTASPAEIKKAYRRKVAIHHPDKGGNAEEFHRVNSAYKILADPTKRARYDETGDAEIADKWDQIVEIEFTKLILMILDDDPPDVAAIARQAIAGKQKQIAAEIRRAQKELEKNSNKISRVKLITAGSDPVLDALQHREAKLRENIREAEADTKLYDAILLQLDRYEFKKKEPDNDFNLNRNSYRPIFSNWPA